MTTAQLRALEGQVLKEEITYSRMVEIIDESHKRKVHLAQLEILQGYYNKIQLDCLSMEKVLDMLENDMKTIRDEFNLINKH